MTGIDKIISQIRKEAEDTAAQTVADAREKAGAMHRDAEAEARRLSGGIAEKAAQERADRRERAASGLELEKRRRILAEKQKLIGELIEQALASLKELPAEEYFAVLLKIAAKHALPQPGVIVFGEKDLKRLPGDFETRLNGVLPEGGRLTADKKPGAIDCGFLLVYGGVEENCTFEALFDDLREELQDKVHELLFT